MGVIGAERVRVWTAAREEELKRLYDDGLSAQEIAIEMRCGLTRNAVIGKVHRLGLSRAKPKSTPYKYRERPPALRKRDKERAAKLVQARQKKLTSTRQFAVQQTKQGATLVPRPDEADAAAFDRSVPRKHRCQLIDLKNHDCRWAVGEVGDEDFFFCGIDEADFEHGVPYCNHHRQRGGAGYGKTTQSA